MQVSLRTLYLAFLVHRGLAHPGHDLSEEILERRSFKNSVRSASLAHCADTLSERGVNARSSVRRASVLDRARQLQGLTARDVDAVLSASHNETELGYTENTSISDIFSGNSSCVLTPEVTQGPYYVGGEYIRQNISEDQQGLNIYLDYQVIDVDTCEPVPNVYIEIWHCNSTGVYSGVVANGNGESSDASNIDKTFLRGIQKTDTDGVAQFESVFPGHYTGRATHIHVLVHTNATEYSNHTLGNQVYASHVGQSFFDQDLISAVEALEPYKSNTQDITTNADDSILSEEADTVDPLMAYTLLGETIGDGLLAWLSFGINTSYVGEVTPATFQYESGGVENPDSGMGGPGGGPGGGPDGGPPSGTDGNGGPSATESALSPSDTSMGNRYTAGAIAFSLIGFFLPLLWI